MAFDADDEILQDFLVEGSEILEKLSEQLVELEQAPTDTDLLNAVFRGFHTIKGGASFINLTGLVDVCHVAEDVFNLLRQGEREVNAHVMDVMLRVLDVLNEMFETLRGGEEPETADPELINQLKEIKSGKIISSEPEPDSSTASNDESSAALPHGNQQQALDETMEADRANTDEISDQEFEELLDQLEQQNEQSNTEITIIDPFDEQVDTPVEEKNSDDISDEEFESLLDEFHSKDTGGGLTAKDSDQQQPAEVNDVPSTPLLESSEKENITDEEFENLLDELHGPGKHTVIADASPENTPVSQFVQPTGDVSKPIISEHKQDVVESKPIDKVTKDANKKPVKEASSPQSETTVRVDTKRLDDIMNMVGELVLVRNRLMTLESALGNEEIAHAIGNLDLVTGDLQAAVMKTRMQPIKKVFGRFPRVVRDLARSLKKEVNLELQGEETDLDKNLVEALADPLVHLVRNAVDHGIEMPNDREKAGKPKQGNIVLSAEQEGDHILLIISDDGGGMDPDVLRRKAVEKGVMDEDSAARLDDQECFALIFSPGFSTKSEISDISGRGVGMDVVKTRIVQLNGSIEIDSKMGSGTRLSIKVPLTLAIMPTLMVRLQRQIFALPLTSVSEIFNLDLTRTNVVDGQLVIMLREKPLPLFFLADWLINNGGQSAAQTGHVVVVSVGNQRVGFVVEHLIGQEEVVIKPLGAMLHGTQGLAGATITGDGRIALILDVPSLVKCYGT